MLERLASALAASVANLHTQATRLAVAAGNVANARSRGVDPGAGAKAGDFIPKEVDQVSLKGGGTRSVIRDAESPSLEQFDEMPGGAPVFLANVDLASEAVNQILAQRSYEASLTVIEAVEEITKRTLDIKS